MKHAHLCIIVCIVLAIYSQALAQSVPAMKDIPESINAAERDALLSLKAQLEAEKQEIIEKTETHNKECTGVDENSKLAQTCAAEQSALQDKIVAYGEAVTKFNEHVDSALSQAHGNKSSPEPDETMIKQDIEAAKERIPELEKQIKGLQTLLRQFGASLRGNVSEFEKWQETFNAAADNSLKTAKEYGLSMFLQYNLMSSLEARVKKAAYVKLDSLINSHDPKVKLWLGEQMKKRNIELEGVKKAVSVGTLSGDFASLLQGDSLDTGKSLDILLFVNDLFETTKLVSWTGSQYFQQARMIGETYTDLAAYALSCINVNKVEKTTDAYNQEIKRLSAEVQGKVGELNCLKGCLSAYSEGCLDTCAGEKRFETPMPSPSN